MLTRDEQGDLFRQCYQAAAWTLRKFVLIGEFGSNLELVSNWCRIGVRHVKKGNGVACLRRQVKTKTRHYCRGLTLGGGMGTVQSGQTKGIPMSIEDYIANAKAAKIGSDSVNIDGTRYNYDILPVSHEPNVPYFVGYPSEYLFISAQVPEKFRKAVLAHEVKCDALRKSGAKHYCANAFEQELKFVPGDIAEYLSMRRTMFDALLTYYKDSDNKDFLAEITRTRDRIMQSMGR